ncbi:MAG: VOC family protein [Caldilineaceae bacterium]|nr:VOC family protein [Caldilineaceae bacterium]MCY4092284.1 VOC family protein [Caldilineaceae bacterium]MCY4116160.1 VOC family protein [Caldilineaceae bacterium]MDE0180798.1 VOC family protein [Caldilineaceae bacterium]MDE0429594.1 VOC family protein [Caldilineaceae bacterium]
MISSVNVMDHVSVTVSDMDRSLAFYKDLLGMEEIERHRLEGETISKMAGKDEVIMQVVRLQAPETPGMLLDLQEYVQPHGKVSDGKLGDVGHSHICFGVPDLAQAYKELQAEGVKFVSEPVSFDLGWAIVHVVFFEDPDGYILELMQVPYETKNGEH